MAKSSNWISVSADVEEIQRALEGTSKSLTAIQRQSIAVIARGTVKAIKREISDTTEKHTGELLKCYGYRIKKDGSSSSVYPRGISGSRIFPKVFALNYGTDKKPHLRPRAFVQKGEQYVQQGDYMTELEKLVEQNLQKYWG